MNGLLVAMGILAGCMLAAAAAFALKIRGDAYFRRPAAERERFRKRVQAFARRVAPLLEAVARRLPRRVPPTMSFAGVTGPFPACTPSQYRKARDFRPDERDIFVATQMKCGTTWMQQVVYEILMHGRGNLGDDGHRHMYALSPWIESQSAVSLDKAPRIGSRGMRIIKTHLPTLLCPYDERARYVYVTRHPVACFASTLDFVRLLFGPFAPDPPALADWFCSDRMWWRSWPEHVEGWWQWASERPNVLFVHYEAMLDDLPGVVSQVAALLGEELSAEEHAEVVRKSRFDWMKEHENVFEMSPPMPLYAGGSHLKSGRGDRKRDVGPELQERIRNFCRTRLANARYPAARFYEDLA